MVNRITQGDCLELMKQLEPGSVDMILCDLPYGTTQNKWDSVIPLDPLWACYLRICKPTAAIVLTCAQPFTSALVLSNPKLFKYEWIWNKVRVTGHLNAKKQPMRAHESVVVFYRSQCVYNPQMTPSGGHIRGPFGKQKKRTENYGVFSDDNRTHEASEYYPRSIITFQAEMQSIHPTQKPTSLFEYLILTYTDPSEVVLDNCIGSGTTAIACLNTGRNFIGFELSQEYVDIANKRLNEWEPK